LYKWRNRRGAARAEGPTPSSKKGRRRVGEYYVATPHKEPEGAPRKRGITRKKGEVTWLGKEKRRSPYG